MARETSSPSVRDLREVALLFLKLGLIAFGGPAAHIAMMRDEVVRRRGWMDDQDFLDMVGATNLVPGPNSTEMAIHLGFRRAGWRGLIAAGLLFIGPAMLIVLVLAVLYVEYGTSPEAGWLLYGIKPAIIAIVAQALWGLGRRAARGPLLAVIGVGVLALYLIGINEIVLLLLGGGIVVAVRMGRSMVTARSGIVLLLPGVSLASIPVAQVAATFSMATLFLNFLKVGAVLYGSGYVLLAFLRADFVDRLGWLTDQQLLDAVAIGQLTPGPVFTTATFVGYVVGGWQAALVATLGIFLPSFVFVALLSRILPLIRRSRWAGAALDGVNVASLGLMGGVTWQLSRASIVDPFTAVMAIVATVVVFRTSLNTAWIVLGAGVLGVGYNLVVG